MLIIFYCIMLALIVIVSVADATSVESFGVSEDACSLRLCKCHRRMVNCNGLNLTYIPRIPSNITSLSFDYNYLPNVSRKTFVNISSTFNTSIISLNFKYNKIENFEKGCLADLWYLKKLSLSGNPLSINSAVNLLQDVGASKIKWMEMRHIKLKYIPNDVFNGMEPNYLSSLDLSNNELTVFNFTVFNSLRRLRSLNLEQNKIKKIIFDRSMDLDFLSLSANSLRDLPDFCDVSPVYFHNLRELHLQNNNIHEYVPENMNCLKKLDHLEIGYNYFTNIRTDYFHGLTSLNYLSLNDAHKPKLSSFLTIQNRAFNNSKIQTLLLQNIKFKIEHVHKMAFTGCENMHRFDISNNRLTDSSHKYVNRLNDVLAPLTSLRQLAMDNTGLNSLPTVLDENFPNLELLSLNGNFITSWTAEFWKNHSKLGVFNVYHNMIKTVTPEMFPYEIRHQLKSINLAKNPFNCDCNLVWFVNWINQNSNKFWLYPRGYRCLNITERICLKNTPVFYSIISVSCLLIVIILVSSIIYKYRWLIKYQIYIWRYKPRELLNLAERNFIYDVFVSYCAEDSDWVLNQLLPKIENQENIKLCIHQRDFQVGRLIVDNIVQCIESSRRVLLVLSNNFVKSEWCRFEMTLAQKHVLDMNMDYLVVVLLEEIESENMSQSLQALFKTTTYITWTDDFEYIHICWDKLKRSLLNDG